jgi:hypothetical protein
MPEKGLAKQEQTVSRAGANELTFALKSSLIAESARESLVQVLRLAMMKVGLRAINLPTPEETAVLIDHIVTNYPGNRVAEIRLAFDMAIAGKLNVEVNCYENFSCSYFSSIMNAYRAWAAQEYRQAVKEEPVEVKNTDQELDDLHRGDVEAFFQRCRSGIVPMGVPSYFKDILEKDGMLKDETVEVYLTRKLGDGSLNIYTK